MGNEKDYAKTVVDWAESNDIAGSDVKLEMCINIVTRPVQSAIIKVLLNKFTIKDLYDIANKMVGEYAG